MIKLNSQAESLFTKRVFNILMDDSQKLFVGLEDQTTVPVKFLTSDKLNMICIDSQHSAICGMNKHPQFDDIKRAGHFGLVIPFEFWAEIDQVKKSIRDQKKSTTGN